MKYLLGLGLACFLLFGCQSSLSLRSDKLNKYRLEGTEKLKHGTWLELDSTGELSVAKFKLGEKHGKEVKIDNRTNFYTIGHYKNGLKHGVFKKYREDGKLMSKCRYRKDSLIDYRIYITYSPVF